MKNSKSPKGEASLDTGTAKVTKFDFKPIPVAMYDAKGTGVVEKKKAAGAGKLPYVETRFELLNTSGKKGKGGKNRTVRHRFFLKRTPTESGFVMVLRQDQIVAYCKALGIKAKLPLISMTETDAEGNSAKVQVVDSDAVVKLLEKTKGKVFKLKTKNEKDQTDPNKLWPLVDFFGPADEEDAEESDDDEETEEEEEADDEDDQDDDDDSGDDEDSDDEDEDDSDDEEDDDSDDEDDDDESDEDEDEDEDDEDDDEDEDEDVEEDEDDEEEEEEEAPKKRGKKPTKKAAPKKKGKK